jgi:hypothetical protein
MVYTNPFPCYARGMSLRTSEPRLEDQWKKPVSLCIRGLLYKADYKGNGKVVVVLKYVPRYEDVSCA